MLMFTYFLGTFSVPDPLLGAFHGLSGNQDSLVALSQMVVIQAVSVGVEVYRGFESLCFFF